MPRRTPLLAPFLLAVTSALAPPASEAKDEAPPPSTIGEIAKRHNQPTADGKLALHLRVPADVRGRKGATVTCVVFFADDAGRYVPSRREDFAGPDGSIRLLATDRIVESDREAMEFAFALPYEAFPRREPGRYRVEARARLVLRAAAGNVVLAEGTTAFWVEG